MKNPDYPDTMYVTELVATDTVITMPEQTLQAYAEHGELRGDTVTGTAAQAQEVFDPLERSESTSPMCSAPWNTTGWTSSPRPGPSWATPSLLSWTGIDDPRPLLPSQDAGAAP